MAAGSASPRPLVICADDYGMSPGIDAAILALAEGGRISAASCMANAPGWAASAARIAPFRGRIGIGLHLTLTWGRPLGPMPVLCPDGRLPGLGRLMALALAGRLPRAEIAAEIDRQLDAFASALGRPPDFVDGHQHVHVLPGVRGALLTSLKRRGLAERTWLRDPSDRPGAILARRVSAPKALLIRMLALGLRADAARAGFATNRGFSGFSQFDPARDLAADMARWLDRLGPSPLLMCHPGLASDAGGEGGPDEIAAARQAEYAYLASPAFASFLVERGIQPVARPDIQAR